MAKRILIADDEANIVASLEFLMRQKGYEVRTVGNGADALKAVAEFAPDLMLLDVMMPQMSGYDVCQKVRADPQGQKVRIVMLSAKGREAEVSKGLALGADAYVTKPFSTRDLVVRVGEMLGE
jgi:DNA-binding response OmpR family regulator